MLLVFISREFLQAVQQSYTTVMVKRRPDEPDDKARERLRQFEEAREAPPSTDQPQEREPKEKTPTKKDSRNKKHKKDEKSD